jgi:protein-L-isoaspartate(D-aspartate) O-methyltransferase
VSRDQDGPPRTDPFAAERAAMVRDQLEARGIHDRATLAAMALVPREAFVPEEHAGAAYADGAMSIGHGQTISQPYIVARMTALLDLPAQGWPWGDAPPPVLDVGTGSGYQAAVLAQCGARVVSIERDPELAAAARERLARLGYEVEVLVGDGSVGYPSGAPYAGIVVAAASPRVPQPLVEQLADGACLVVPVGSRHSQQLQVVRRQGHRIVTSAADDCVFVPLLGAYGHRD